MARLHGVQHAYYDVNHRRRTADPDSLVAILRALGVEIESVSDASECLQRDRAARLARGVEPVLIAWDGKPTQLELCLPADRVRQPIVRTLRLEGGETRRVELRPDELSLSGRADSAGTAYEFRRVPIAEPLPAGYHRLTIEASTNVYSTFVIAAPKRTYRPSRKDAPRKAWGTFLPLYAVESEGSWGAGSYTDLGSLAEWLGGLGGSVLGTLPLLPTFLGVIGTPGDPSPYSPLSRLFWNEFYIDVTAIPELAECAAAREMVESASARAEIDALRAMETVDYPRVWMLKRRALEILSDDFFRRRPPRYAKFQQHLDQHPAIESYARFRAACERQGRTWTAWPETMRRGHLAGGDFDARTRDFYLYVQWIASEQIRSVSERAAADGVALYLDLPLGVNPGGYDMWRHREIFATKATVGAPPDPVFSKGQNWGFSPLHPEAVRAHDYGYVIDFVRHHLRFAGMLRIDHAMGLHRKYWIPEGMDARQGVFVQYHADELYAVLSLESHRHQAALVAENLGTVPSYVNSALNRHQILQMYVVQYELEPDRTAAMSGVPRNCVASLNTHDMPPFAAFWEDEDINDRRKLGLLDAEFADAERDYRLQLRERLVAWLRSEGLLDTAEPDPRTVMRRLLDYLAASPAQVVIVSLEDLWLETRPQNVPGTSTERPNWIRKARYRIEEIRAMPEVVEALQSLSQRRGGAVSAASARSGAGPRRTEQKWSSITAGDAS